jgi:hypothetical protein
MNQVDVDSAKDEQDVVNGNYTFTVQTTIKCIRRLSYGSSKTVREWHTSLMMKLCMGMMKKLSNLVSCAEGINGHRTGTKTRLKEVQCQGT